MAAVAPVAVVESGESAVPYGVYIATSGTNATAHVAIAHARPGVLELALKSPRLNLPDETDRLNINIPSDLRAVKPRRVAHEPWRVLGGA